jgi:hypothetical protein
MKTLAFSTGIHILSFLEDLSVRPSTVSFSRLPPRFPSTLVKSWMTFANFASSLFPQVYQPSRRPLNACEPSLVAPFCVSRLFALGHHFLPQDLVTRHLTATAVSHSHAPYIHTSLVAVPTQRPRGTAPLSVCASVSSQPLASLPFPC